MTDVTAEFFDGLARRGREPRFKNVHGTIRFDISYDHRVEYWFVEIADGKVGVSRRRQAADCQITTDHEMFDRLVKGEASPGAAWLRNRVNIQGELLLLRFFERLYPGPATARDPREVGRSRAAPKTTEESGPVAGIKGGDTISILDGNTFLVCDNVGNVLPSCSSPTGFFAFDTRFLSTWRLSVNGEELQVLSVDDLEYYETRFFLVPGEPTHYLDAKASVIRRQSIGRGFEEWLTVLNHSTEPADIRVHLEIEADFADLFEIRGLRKKEGTRYARVEGGGLRLGYQRESFRREAVVSSTEPAQVDETGMTFDIRIGAHQEWQTKLSVATLGADGRELRVNLQGFPSRPRPQMRRELDEWLSATPTLRCDSETLSKTYRRSLIDLAAMRYRLMGVDTSLLLGGLPWYMCIFMRNTILASFQALPFAPELAATTLTVGIQHGKKLDDYRDEEPGKIFHEYRLGELAAFEELPHTPYFGSADTTPLWLILLDEYERWTGDDALVRRREPEARRCLDWIDTYADAMGTGYIWYRRRSPAGLENQGWKSSWDAISYHDGTLPDLPRATCELQGYAYDAKLRAARLAREFWNDPRYADRLEREAAELRQRFNRDFWIEDRGFYALALDPDGRQVDALASNIGHLLWSGIVPAERAERVAEHLLGPGLFSGWGVRTLGTAESRYNPLGYHTGTVWPFDNAFIAWGLRRYGLTEQATRIAEVMIDVSGYFHGRLPEAFAGYDRELTTYPVQYPGACAPFSLSAGSVLLLLRTMLGLNPNGDHLTIEPALPRDITRLELLDIPGRWGRRDAFGIRRAD